VNGEAKKQKFWQLYLRWI